MLNTFLVVMLMMITPPGNSIPSFVAPLDLGGGGPDVYGYTWLDSDTAAPGAPVYNWIRISGTGTRITGLRDDNVVGPFPVGFEFPYYWYTVNSFYVGSNGYISFGDNFNAASPFYPVPNPAFPNNVLAPLMTDLDFSVGTPSCWYWTNGAADTLIVEYDSVRFWNRATSINSFQIILSRPDSTITFQYKDQVGTPYPAWGDSCSAIGIENVSGVVGLRYLYEGLPASNLPQANLAIRFTPPESSSYQVHDVGIYEALSPKSTALFIYNGDSLTPWAKVKNTGNQTEVNFPVCGWIKNQSGTIIYADTVQAGSMNPGQIDSMLFAPDWIASTNGQFTFTAKTTLTGDMFAGNDQKVTEMHVVTYPAELQYENVITTQVGMSWNGPGGFGNRFVPPRYPCWVTGAKIFSWFTTPTPIFVGVLDDNGLYGSPGDTLVSTTINVGTTAAWINITFSHSVEITDGAFFIGAISAITSRPNFGMDTLAPFSRQTWEYTTGWAPSRHAEINDALIRALVASQPGIEEISPANLNSYQISATPNPFGNMTRITFTNPQKQAVTFKVYNSTGACVNTITSKNEEITWNGRDAVGKKLAAGIYFLKLNNEPAVIEKLIITR